MTRIPEVDSNLTGRPDEDGDDPALDQFLDFLARDIDAHPAHVQALDVELMSRIHALVGGVALDLDAALLPRDE